MTTNDTTNAGGETRRRLIEAGVRLFGLHGFEATATRTLAAAAGANLGAIRYHFGGKEGLYRAVLEHIVRIKLDDVRPELERLSALCADPAAGRDRLLGGLRAMVRTMVAVMLDDPASQPFSQIMMQEQIAPTPAYDILYEGFFRKIHAAWAMLLARLTGLAPDSPELQLRTLTVMGQFVIFRVGMPAILRRLGLEKLDREHLDGIAAIGCQQVEAIIAGFAPVCRPVCQEAQA